MTKEQVIEQSMQMILHAGDARKIINELLNDISNLEDVALVDAKMNEAKSMINIAHAAQTKVVQEEVAKEDEAEVVSLLFTHAQDTLMTVYSEYNTALKLIKVFQHLNNKIDNLSK